MIFDKSAFLLWEPFFLLTERGQASAWNQAFIGSSFLVFLNCYPFWSTWFMSTHKSSNWKLLSRLSSTSVTDEQQRWHMYTDTIHLQTQIKTERNVALNENLPSSCVYTLDLFSKTIQCWTVRSLEWTWEVCSACLQRGVGGRQVKMLTRQTRALLLTHRVGNVGLTSERWGEPHTVHLKGKKVKSQVVCSSVKLLCSFLGQTNSPMRATFRLWSDSILQIRLNTCHRLGLPSQPLIWIPPIFLFIFFLPSTWNKPKF